MWYLSKISHFSVARLVTVMNMRRTPVLSPPAAAAPALADEGFMPSQMSSPCLSTRFLCGTSFWPA